MLMVSTRCFHAVRYLAKVAGSTHQLIECILWQDMYAVLGLGPLVEWQQQRLFGEAAPPKCPPVSECCMFLFLFLSRSWSGDRFQAREVCFFVLLG